MQFIDNLHSVDKNGIIFSSAHHMRLRIVGRGNIIHKTDPTNFNEVVRKRMINGAYLKQLRQSSKYTLAQLSEETGYTASFLSQIERGLKEPSLATLRKLSECFGVPLVSFFSNDENDAAEEERSGGYAIVRRESRHTVELPGLAVKCETLSPSMPVSGGREHFVRGAIYTVTPGSWCSEGMVSHTYDECIYVLRGQIKVCVQDRTVFLSDGDCIYICAATRHNFQNCGEEDCSCLTFSD